MLATIPIDMIENGQRLRDLSEATVEALVNSIADVGLLNPITVYPRKLYHGGNQVDGYGLVAGLHRKTAYERLGLTEIEANIVDLSDLECQIAECDENLVANQLSASDRARFTKRRKEAYEALHPEAKHGGDRKSDQVANLSTRSFAADQAAVTGADERTVRRDAERGEKVDAKALDMVHGTKLDTGTYLDTLKKLPVTEQLKRVRADLAKPKAPLRKIIRVADAPLDDEDAKERQVAALMSAWNKASAEARQEFLERIDTPVFDRSAA
jgi:ParB family transcriptional regulator, chromosome partitioning protein